MTAIASASPRWELGVGGMSSAGVLEEAWAYLELLQREFGKLGPDQDRVATVCAEVARTGTYRHTEQELVLGAKLAWRNTARCLGKFYWNALKVRDLRHLTTAEDVFDATVEHLRLATSHGRIRLLLTAFAPQEPGRPGIRIWNSQLVRYAGYRQPDGSVVGDPASVTFTEVVCGR
jgi:nitric-oxide synthase, bacterial